MFEKYGRFPKKNEWFGSETEEEWIKKYLEQFPKPLN